MRKHPLAHCEVCPYQEMGQFVPSLFPIKPIKLAVIGEAPGPQEARTGIPFTGPSGDLLNTVLQHHNVERTEVLLTNACLCRPFGPTEAPPKSALAACSERLYSEIEASGATRLVAVGGTAAKVLVDDSRTITKLRVGPAKPYKKNPKIDVVATFHPAFCLRNPDAFPSFIHDLGKIQKNHGNWVEPEYKVFNDPTIAREALRRMEGRASNVTLDIEAGTDKDIDYTHPEEFDLLCVGLGYAPRKAVVFGYDTVHDKEFLNIFGNFLRRTKITAHNGKFDLRALSPHVGVQALEFDTMLASYTLDERPGHHGLKALSSELLGAPEYDKEIKQYTQGGGSYSNIPKNLLYKYNAIDVCCTWDLREIFLSRMNEDNLKAHQFLIAASNSIIHLELAGIKFDDLYNKELDDEYLQRITNIEDKINSIIGYKINPRSVPQVSKYLLSQGLRFKTTNKDFLEEILPKLTGEPKQFVRELLTHRRESKLYGTYIKGLAKKTTYGRVYTTYLLHGTTSGRLSSRNPNMQNIVRNKAIRNQFTVSNEENLLLQLDYKQAEGRVIATLAKDIYLQSIFSDSSRDIFDELTTRIYGDQWTKEERVKIKAFFYGLSYGREAPSIAQEFEMEISEAKELLSSFKALIPKTIEWQNKITQRVLGGEDLITPFGRKRSFYLITNDNKRDVLNEALSFMPQSIASDICLSALISLQPLLKDLAQIRLTIHDALVLECHKDNLEVVSNMAKDEMINAGRRFTDFVPFLVDVSVGKRLGEFS